MFTYIHWNIFSAFKVPPYCKDETYNHQQMKQAASGLLKIASRSTKASSSNSWLELLHSNAHSSKKYAP